MKWTNSSKMKILKKKTLKKSSDGSPAVLTRFLHSCQQKLEWVEPECNASNLKLPTYYLWGRCHG